MAIYKTKKYGDADVKVVDVVAFDNESFNGFEVNWFCDKLGFGSCTFLFSQDDEGNSTFTVETECMSSNNDKRFLTALFEDVVARSNVVE